MKKSLTLVALTVPVAFAGIIAFHPGVAFAGTKLQLSQPAKSFGVTGDFGVDPFHTTVGFDISHLGLSRVQGRFAKVSGSIHTDATDPAKSNVNISIDAASVDTAVAPRDEDLRSPNFFDVQKFPTLEFKSTSITKKGNGYIAKGDLTLHGVTKKVSIPFKQYGPIKDPWGNQRIGVVSDPIVINRADYGMTFDAPPMVGNDVNVRISLEATLKK